MVYPDIVINGVVYANCPEVDIPIDGGGTAKYYETSNANVLGSEVLIGKKFYGSDGEDTGRMANNGSTSGTISTKNGTVTIPEGYTSGGTVSIDPSAVADCIGSSILSGRTILGVSGFLSVPTISQDNTTKILSIS